MKNADGQPITGLNTASFTLTGTVPESRLFLFGARIDHISEDNGVYTIDVLFLAAGQYMLNLKANGVQIPGTVTAAINADNEPAVKLCSYTQVPDVVPECDMSYASNPYSFDIKFHMVNAASIPLDNLDLSKFYLSTGSSSAIQRAPGTQVENLGNGDYVYHCIAPNFAYNDSADKETVLTVIWDNIPIGQGWEKITVSRYVYGH